jgi:hypothetical protein
MAKIVPNHSAFWKRNESRDSFEFQKRGQYFVGSHNETLSVVAMRVSNPDCSSLAI